MLFLPEVLSIRLVFSDSPSENNENQLSDDCKVEYFFLSNNNQPRESASFP